MKKPIAHAVLVALIVSCASSVQAYISWTQWFKNGVAALSDPKSCVKIGAGIAGGLMLGAGIAHLWMRYYSYTLNPCWLSGDSLLNYLRAKYKPSKEKCGAAVTESNDRLPDDFWAALISLVDGHRDIYWGSQADLTPVVEQVLRQANIGIIKYNKVIPAAFEDQHGKKYRFNNFPSSGYMEQLMILYRPNGKANALLFHRYLTTMSMLNNYNDYLMGTLLGYSENDIRHYYNTKTTIKPFDVDRQEALEWLAKNRE